MKKIRLFCVMLIVAVGCCLAYGDDDIPATVVQFKLTDEMPTNSVRCMYQDSDGYIWFGTTGGLCRYDGYRLVTYRSGSSNRNLLTSNDIISLYETSSGDLLIGTSRGMNVLDKKRVNISVLEITELRDYEIRTLVEDEAHNIWVGTHRQLVRLSADYSKIKVYGELPLSSVNELFLDKDSNLWVAFWEGGLYRYDSRSDKFMPMPAIGQRNSPRSLFQMSDGSYLVSTWGDGVWRLYPDRPSDNMIEPVKVVEGDPSKVAITYGIVQDRYGYFWIVGDLGLSLASISGNEMRILDVPEITGNMNNVFSNIMMDREDGIWIAAFTEGAYMVRPERPMVKSYAFKETKSITGGLDPYISSIYRDGNGLIWVNQNRWGLGIYDIKNDKIRFYDKIPELASLKGLSSTRSIKGFRSDPDAVYVCCSYEPYIYKVNSDTSSIKVDETWTLTDGGGGNPISLDRDPAGNIWIVTRNNLMVRTPAGAYVNVIKNEDGNDFNDIKCDSHGNAWVATNLNGLVKISEFSPGVSGKPHFTITKMSDVPGGSVSKIDVDNVSKRVWCVSNYDDFFMVDMSTGEVSDRSEKLNSIINGGIQNFVVDNDGNVWFTTNNNVCEYNTETDGYIIYSNTDDEAIRSIIGNSVYYDPPGDIYLGGDEGVICFHSPSQLFKELSEHPPVITDVKINGKSCFTSLDLGVSFDDETFDIKLPADARNIEIDFSTLNYSHPDCVSYSYRLSGVDDDWADMPDNRSYAYYNSLPKGRHTLEIRATDAHGNWSKSIARYTITRRNAWYETWWAETIYALVLVGALALVVIWLKHRFMLREKLRRAEMDKRNTEEITQMKLRYFTNVTHDFLTPITIINCLIDDLEITYGKAAPSLNKMRSNLGKLRRLIQEVLDFRKFENGKMKLKISRGDLYQFLDEVCRNHFDPLMSAKHINFTLNFDSMALPAYFDSDKVEKIIFNLISNAYKYTDEGGAVELSVKMVATDGENYAMISVKDNGKGISAEDLPHVFDRFFAHGSRHVSSNGIGLSLVKDLVGLHKGTIDVKSEVGSGTEFTVMLPIDRHRYSDDEMLLEQQPYVDSQHQLALDADVEGAVADESMPKYTLLLVEDNEELLTVMGNIFMRDYNVLTARNGAVALDLAHSNDVDIVVSDLMMPEMDGLEFCRKMKSDIKTSHVPFILLTAKNRPEDRVNCYKAGADGYIAKPFELKVLQARIDNFLSNKHIAQAEFRDSEDVNTGVLEMSVIDKEFMEKAVAMIKSHIEDSNLDIDMMTRELCVSRASLYRKIKALTGMSPVELVRNIRLKYSYDLLKEGKMSIASVAYASGFSNPKYYSTCFKEQFGISPRDVFKEEPSRTV